MDKVQKYNSFNTNTPSSESYRNVKYLLALTPTPTPPFEKWALKLQYKINPLQSIH
jgi:hypothetical protein